MVIIDIFDYIKNQSNIKFENKSLEEIKEDLEELYEYNIVLEDLERNFFDINNSIHIKNDDLIQIKLFISKIKEKQEIIERLNSLSYSVEWLKASSLIKDNTIRNKAISNILKNPYSSISSIIKELNSLKNNIDKLENLHINLLKSGLSLDVKALLEQDFRNKHKKLNELHNKQKNILLNLSNIFFKLAKDSVLKNKK